MSRRSWAKANKPRGERDYVADTLRKLELALEDAERQSSRLSHAARDARRAAERAKRLLRSDPQRPPSQSEDATPRQPLRSVR
jgi:hypothetical protein